MCLNVTGVKGTCNQPQGSCRSAHTFNVPIQALVTKLAAVNAHCQAASPIFPAVNAHCQAASPIFPAAKTRLIYHTLEQFHYTDIWLYLIL